jgi:RNA-directed DNA polymerase
MESLPTLTIEASEQARGIVDERWLEAICKKDNVDKAVRRVKKNKKAVPGIDGMTVADLDVFIQTKWVGIERQLLEGTYEPQPVKRSYIPKSKKKLRKIGIPIVVERVIQNAILEEMQKKWDPTFSLHSFAFRNGLSQHDAVFAVKELILDGYEWVVDLELAEFFDTVPHDKLMARIEKYVKDFRLLKLIEGFLKADVVVGQRRFKRWRGTPQGGPLSPFLSNILLDAMDKELESRGCKFVRYADDCRIFARDKNSAFKLKRQVKQYVENVLKLKVNEDKTKVVRVRTSAFLGYKFGPNLDLLISSGAIRKIWVQLQLTIAGKHKRKNSTEEKWGFLETIEKLNEQMEGSVEYYKFTTELLIFEKLDADLRRSLRRAILNKFKTGIWTEELKGMGWDKDLESILRAESGSRNRQLEKFLSDQFLNGAGLRQMVELKSLKDKKNEFSE